jgi:hypothetical protein
MKKALFTEIKISADLKRSEENFTCRASHNYKIFRSKVKKLTAEMYTELCSTQFLNLTKAFDPVNHSLLIEKHLRKYITV